jgi:CIC family chloride channel protein
MVPLNPQRAARLPSGRLAWMARHLPPMEQVLLIVLAMGVGLVSGLGAVGFHYLVEFSHHAFFAWPEHTFGAAYHQVRLVLTPALGALVAGSLVWLLARHDHSHGTAAVMEAVALRGGRLPVRPFLTKSSAAGVLIGAGGSAGPEDPSVQIGAVVGSWLGNRLGLSSIRVNTLVTAGVASAISAAFNAPIAGVFFAMEIVAADFSTTLFAPVVLASVVASIVGRAFLGEQPAFAVPAYTLSNPLVETPLYLLLGLVAAVVGVAFIRAIFLAEALFARVRLPAPLKAGVGGLLVGLIALHTPAVLGDGYELVGELLNDSMPGGAALLVLLALKFLATVLTLGAVRVGGTFAPAMVMGAIVGGAFGQVVTLLLPGQTAPPAAYALVGMGAMLVAVVHAPITAVLLLFEVTGDYRIILAIMASVVTSHLFAYWLHTESIYSERLRRKGLHLHFGRDVNILELVRVGEAMTPDFTTVPHTMTLAELGTLFDSTTHHGFPVLDDNDELFGMVTLKDLYRATEAGYPHATTVAEIATRDLIVAYPDQHLNAALNPLALADVGRLPVVDSANPKRLLGVLRRNDVIRAYRRGAMQRAEIEHRRTQMQVGSESGAQMVEITLPEGSASEGQALRDLHLPGQAIITSIRRNDATMLPNGNTVLHGGDQLTLLAMPDEVPLLEPCLISAHNDVCEPRYMEVELPAESASNGRAIRDLPLPNHVIITAIHRNDESLIPRGDTVLQAGDQLTVLAMPDELAHVQACLVSGGVDATVPRYHELLVPHGALAAGRTVKYLGLPREALIVTLRRDGDVYTVHGQTRIEGGDELVILATESDFQQAVRCIIGEARDDS